MTLREVFEAFDSKKKHKLMFYFWMVTIPFVLGFATSSYCILDIKCPCCVHLISSCEVLEAEPHSMFPSAGYTYRGLAEFHYESLL